mgnify:CR=1 FL=1
MKRGKKDSGILADHYNAPSICNEYSGRSGRKSKQLDALFTHDTHSHLNSFFNNCRWRTERSRRICEAKDSD